MDSFPQKRQVKILYLGLQPPKMSKGQVWMHLPIIQIIPIPPEDVTIQQALKNIADYTHIIFTSQSTVSLFFDYVARHETDLTNKTYVAVGTKTAHKLRQLGATNILVASNETAEGIIEILETIDLTGASFFWPHSFLSRPVIEEWLKQRDVPYKACVFYNTVPNSLFPKPDLSSFDEIVFTSPSTIDAFLTFYGTFPLKQTFRCIGPITKSYFDKLQA